MTGQLHGIFTTSWSREVWTTTLVLTMLLFAAAGTALLAGMSGLGRPGRGVTICLVIAVLILLATVGGAFFAPAKYVVDSIGITIWRLGPKVTIPWSDIVEVQIAKAEVVFTGAWRRWASDGAFGYYGKFGSPALGNFDAYVTRMDRLVMIRRKKGGPVVISPDDEQRFISTVRELLSKTGRHR